MKFQPRDTVGKVLPNISNRMKSGLLRNEAHVLSYIPAESTVRHGFQQCVNIRASSTKVTIIYFFHLKHIFHTVKLN